MSSKKELLNLKISKLIEQVERAGSWKASLKQSIANGVPINYLTKRHYKGSNIYLLWMKAQEEGYQTNSWLSLKECNKLNGKVNKGEVATNIYFFKPVKIKETNELGEQETTTVPMLRTYRVFNIEQTTLKDKLDTKSRVNSIRSCEEFFSSIELCKVKEGSKPYYSPLKDYISMPNISRFDDANSYYATLAHEMVHATGHHTRLNRDMSNNKDSYAYEELIAELGASFISAHLGIDGDDIQDNAAAYLKHWLKTLKSDPKYLWKAMSEASKAYEYILDAKELQRAS